MTLKEILEENADVVSITLEGEARLVGNTLLASSEILHFNILCRADNTIDGALHFDTLRLQTESSLPSKMLGIIVENLITIDQERARGLSL